LIFNLGVLKDFALG